MKAITIIFLALILVVSGCKPKTEATNPLSEITWGMEGDKVD